MYCCDICAETKNNDEFFPIQGCTHKFCTHCISKHVSIKIKKGKIARFPCPGVDCKGVLEMDACRAIVPSDVISAWDEMICESMISQSHKFYCPYKNCSGLLVNEIESGDDVIIREADNCRAPWHSGIGCEDFLKLGKNEREQEDIKVHELAKKNKWQRCPRCKFFVEKKEGCLHITCM
ncbi:probable E3 ubiquitin-protein ligase ari3 [Phtheirospermum japonicum]|uniref:Probable E3 ubiquitin-protein ligase ari3 n=1 Tax=Phtheirospermum japonicum TaxID=374723 RepID=A0A830CXE2_9LAMI|nr:probable E3 ubiquitin-protein ligase ari3 [Phtheirospermum japonicum]